MGGDITQKSRETLAAQYSHSRSLEKISTCSQRMPCSASWKPKPESQLQKPTLIDTASLMAPCGRETCPPDLVMSSSDTTATALATGLASKAAAGAKTPTPALPKQSTRQKSRWFTTCGADTSRRQPRAVSRLPPVKSHVHVHKYPPHAWFQLN